MHRYYFLTEIEPHSKSYIFITPGSILVENIFDTQVCESFTIIFDNYLDSSGYILSLDSDNRVCIFRKFHSIIKEIIDHLLELYFIDFDKSDLFIYLRNKCNIFIHARKQLDLIFEKLSKSDLLEKKIYIVIIIILHRKQFRNKSSCAYELGIENRELFSHFIRIW